MQNVATFEEKRINPADRRSHEERRSSLRGKEVFETVAGGAFVESAGGIGAVVLTILGLAGIAPVLLTSIATIAIGAVMLAKGVSVSAEYSKIARTVAHDKVETAELSGGLSGEIVTGVAAIVLGILSLLSISALTLLAISAIVLGFGLILSGGADVRLNNLRAATERDHRYERVIGQLVNASVGAELFVGLGAAVLGILALVGFAPVTLILVSMLSLGVTILLSGTSLGGKMLNLVYGTGTE